MTIGAPLFLLLAAAPSLSDVLALNGTMGLRRACDRLDTDDACFAGLVAALFVAVAITELVRRRWSR